MARICDLVPGDQVEEEGMVGIFICRMHHPVYQGLDQVIWYLPLESRYSFDALHFRQEIGNVVPSTSQERVDRLATFLRPRVGD